MKRTTIIRSACGLFLALSLLATTALAQNQIEHGMGLIPSLQAIEPPDYSRIAHITPLPDAVDLSQWAVPAGNQGTTNSCVAWAIAHGLMGWYAKHLNMEETAFAPMYIYSQINVSYMYSYNPQYVLSACRTQSLTDCGAFTRDGLQLTMEQGVDTQSSYLPQGTNNWTDQPTAAQRANAVNYKFGRWNILFSGEIDATGINRETAIKTALTNSHPVVIGMRVRAGFYDLSPTNTLDTDTTSYSIGNHAMLAVGYDKDGLLLQNSWGNGWGSDGFGRVSWAVVRQDVFEAYTVDQIAFNPVVTAYTVTASAGAGGSVGPASASAQPGQTIRFTITPNSGYNLITPVGGTCGGTLSGTAYTTAPVTADCTVAAAFAPVYAMAPQAVTGAWYDPAYTGSGFNMVMTAQGLALFYYVWDSDGNRLWLISDIGPARITLGIPITLSMNQTNGGIFRAPAGPGTLTPWGALQLEFSSCTHATGSLTGADGSRVTFDNLLMLAGVLDAPGC
jgi:hypothetical protein